MYITFVINLNTSRFLSEGSECIGLYSEISILHSSDEVSETKYVSDSYESSSTLLKELAGQSLLQIC